MSGHWKDLFASVQEGDKNLCVAVFHKGPHLGVYDICLGPWLAVLLPGEERDLLYLMIFSSIISCCLIF